MTTDKRHFGELLQHQFSAGKAICVGLDPEVERLPEPLKPSSTSVFPQKLGFHFGYFCEAIVEATAHIACAYKPNLAFFEALGDDGWAALRRVIEFIHARVPHALVIADAKRGDIGNSNRGYVTAIFDYLKADAVTVHPYLGREALEPFLARKDKGVFVLCRTSNPGAGEFQDMVVKVDHSDPEEGGYARLYEYVALRVVQRWNALGNCGVVVGATYPEELASVRNIVGDMPILIPGVGSQQKGVPIEEQMRRVVQAGRNSQGNGMIINASSSIIFASSGFDFANAAAWEAWKLHEAFTACCGELA